VPVWQHEIPMSGSVDLPPDPRAMDALGRNHTLETAVADLVDNSIDAQADEVLIRFVQHGPRLVCLYVVDNGRGIPPHEIDTSMTVGGRREYSSADLGRFGVGLKAASFSQASSVTVLSRAAGALPVGRRWNLDAAAAHHRCDVVPEEFARVELDRGWPFPLTASGTVIRWDMVRAFPSTDDREHVDEYLERTISHLRGNLGLTFHRILSKGGPRITVDVEDTRDGLGLPVRVQPLDPFASPHSPPGWPRTLTSAVGGIQLSLLCHIWPARSNLPQFRLPGGAEHRQGLYFYRRDRLLQAGGWEGIHAPDKRLQLARVAVDMDGDIAGLFTMNAEKSRVIAGPLFADAVHQARASDGTSSADFLHAAEATWTTSNQRASARRAAVLPPGKGFHPRVTREIRDELPLLPARPLNVLWKPLDDDQFFEVDRDSMTLWLNQTYRRALLGGRRGGLNDVPVLKTLLFLLAGNIFDGSHLGVRDKDNIELWQAVLTRAARAERDSFETRS
jgi:hypothetical protein